MSLLEAIRRFSKPSTCLEKRDIDQVHKACHVLRDGLRQRALRYIMDNRDQTMLIQYGSDCTPLVTRERYQHEVLGVKVRRGGRCSQEFLVQRWFAETVSGSSIGLVEVPLPLVSKTAYVHFGAKRELLKSPRECGHQGLVIEFHKYDRAVKSALGRLHLQFSMAWDDQQYESRHPGEAHRLHLLHWFFCEACAAHDTHNGLKWSVLNFTKDKECMRSSFLVHESLRQGYHLLIKHAAGWLRDVVGYENWAGIDLRSFYQSFDVDEDLRFSIWYEGGLGHQTLH